MEERKRSLMGQNIIIESRERVNITGVIDIHSFDDEVALIETDLGILMIKGDNLKMNKLNLDNNELIIEGRLIALNYSETSEMKKGSLIGKLFR